MSEFAGVMASLSSGGDSGSSGGGESSAGAPTAETSLSSSPADAGSESSPSATDEQVTPEGTTAEVGPESGSQPPPGPPKTVPYARLSEVVQERNTLRQQMQALQWAQTIPAEHAPVVAQLYQNLARDPVGTLIQEAEALAASGDPNAAQALRSAAARWLRAGRQPNAPPEVDLTPALQSEDGRAVYTADQVQAIIDQRVQSRVDELMQKLQPLEADVQERKVQQMAQEIRSRAKAKADKIRAYPHFAQHKDAIVQRMKADASVSAEEAYIEIVLPHLTAAEQKRVVQNLHAKAQAGSVTPGRAPAATTAPAPTSFREAFEQVAREARR